ncbi:E3 ubiquitin-protein ligase TRIM39-like protein [Lates japonicus]|uniref:E3 ubiquitin-protein ligase TRIM39-like protein n=1 Tax=Lates japonicus TaxID=270547 RepID=A0AAD3NFB9_LATJO|nr:E3 ubiquitin-protein ligase TRIM39-like protein [Lates japonicus]
MAAATTRGLCFILSMMCLVCLANSVGEREMLEEIKEQIQKIEQTIKSGKANFLSERESISKIMSGNTARVNCLKQIPSLSPSEIDDMDKYTADTNARIRDSFANMAEIIDYHESKLEESLHSLNDPPKTEDWSEISVYSDSAVGTVRSAVTKLLLELHRETSDEMKELVTKEIRRIQLYAVDVTLDSDTANHLLVVSNDGKQVRNGSFPQKLPDNPERFDPLLGVLGKEGYSSGAFYFEVQVEDKTAWDIGVALETVDRKRQSEVCLSNGYVVLMLRDGKILKACDQPPVGINLPSMPKKVGVFVDHEEGENKVPLRTGGWPPALRGLQAFGYRRLE